MAENKILKDPEELERLNKIRAQLTGTDRDDHVGELDDWEQRIKQALIFLNLKGHEGIDMILARANDEIRAINLELIADVGEGTHTEAALIAESMNRRELLYRRKLWTWFKELFTEAESEMDAARAFLASQEEVPPEDPYVGSE